MAPLPFFSNAISIFLLDLEQPEPKLLLMRRKNPPVGAWCQVAGKIKSDETAWQAALREVKEEVGPGLGRALDGRHLRNVLCTPQKSH